MKVRQTAPTLRLYITGGCHLCEQAESLLQSAGALIETVEIADHDDWLAQYGVRIPVVRRLATGEELDWPFDLAAVQRLLNAG